MQKMQQKHATVLCAIITIVITIPVVVMPVLANVDGNRGNDVENFNDWLELLGNADPATDAVVQQLPDQQQTSGYSYGLYPFAPSIFLDAGNLGAELNLYWSTCGAYGHTALYAIKDNDLLDALGLERERDLYCTNGTAHVYWFNSLGYGCPLFGTDQQQPGYFYIVNHAGTWYMNHLAMAYTMDQLLGWISDHEKHENA